MRPIIVLAVSAAILAALPAPAGAREGHIRKCQRITRQLDHFEGQVELARERDNELWERSLVNHMGRLSARREKLCPVYHAEMEQQKRNELMRERTTQALVMAGKVALTVLTAGTASPWIWGGL